MTVSEDLAEARGLGLEETVFGLAEAYSARDPDGPPMEVRALLDASVSNEIPVCLDAFPEEARCVFDGQAAEDYGEAAPWLVTLDRDGPAWDWFVSEGYGQDWGVLLLSALPMGELKRAVKRLFRVTDETGKAYFFKFYRPQHLTTYLPVLESDQVHRFFDGIEAWFAENPAGSGELQGFLRQQDGIYANSYDIEEAGRPKLIRPPNPDALYAELRQASETGKD